MVATLLITCRNSFGSASITNYWRGRHLSAGASRGCLILEHGSQYRTDRLDLIPRKPAPLLWWHRSRYLPIADDPLWCVLRGLKCNSSDLSLPGHLSPSCSGIPFLAHFSMLRKRGSRSCGDWLGVERRRLSRIGRTGTNPLQTWCVHFLARWLNASVKLSS